MTTRDTTRWIEIDWKVFNIINDNRSTFGDQKHNTTFLIQFMLTRYNLCQKIQLSGSRLTAKFLIQLMTTDQLSGLQRHTIRELTYRVTVELDPSLDPARMI